MPHRASRCIVVPLLLAGALAACEQGGDPTGTRARPGDAGLAPLMSAGPDALPGRYIVVLRDGDGAQAPSGAVMAGEVAAAHGATVHHTYRAVLQGFAATLAPAALEAVRRDPRVAYVTEDALAYPDQTTQPGATWGLDRVDQRDLPLTHSYVYGATGAGVRVYVMDTGIRTSHNEFGGRASVGVDLVNDGQEGQDCSGHGTHVAGTIGGATYGVAKEVQLVSVRVFGCGGGAGESTLVAALDWIRLNAVHPAVANYSGGGPPNAALTQATRALVASGVTFVTSAGNDDFDACNKSPASTPEAITVGATAIDDSRSTFSNWGPCVDLFAPGTGITSGWWTSDTATNTINGTSMAAPHVAGAAALHLQGAPAATPADVAAQLRNSGTVARVRNPGPGSPNRLLFSRLTAPPPGPSVTLTPTALSFVFVRPVAGTAQLAAAPQGAHPPVFRSSGGGMESAGAPVAPATTSTTQSARVLLQNHGTAALNWTAGADRPWLGLGPASGTLTETYGTALTATASAAGLAPGTHTGTLNVADPAAVGGPGQVNVTVTVVEPIMLQAGVPRYGLSGAGGSATYYAVELPAGASTLHIGTSGGVGESDLYVRYGDVTGSWNCQASGVGNDHSCTIEWPLAGTYYVMLFGSTPYSGVALAATAGGPPPAPLNLDSRATTPTAVRSTWTDGSTNETGFTLSRRALAGGVWGAWTDVAAPAANAVLHTNTNLAAGGTYQYRLRACNPAGCSAWATGPVVAIPTGPASPPFGVSARAATGTSIMLTWTDGATDETHFNIARALRETDGTWGAYATVSSPGPNTAAFANAGLLAGREYRYQVRACNAVGCSAWATSNSVVLPTAPAAPPSLTAATTAPGTIRVQWTDGSTSETSFTLARAAVSGTGAAGPFIDVATLAPNQVTFTQSGVPLGTYRYRIRACNAAGCSAWTTGADVVLPPAPAAPTGAGAAALSSTAIRVTWTDAATTESSYQVFRTLRNLDGTWTAWASIANPGANTNLYDNTGLLAGRTYRYQVRACNVTACSAWGVTAGVATPP